MDGHQWEPNDPLRPLDWQLRNAQSLTDRGRYVTERQFGSNVWALACVLRSRREATKAKDAAGQFSEVHVAFDLRDGGQTRLRCAVESLIVANVPRSQIAAETGISPDSVAWYEVAFFDIRSRLAAGHFVSQQLELAHRRCPDYFPDWGWKMVAYHRGAEALRKLLGSHAADDTHQFVDEVYQQAELIVALQLHRLAEQRALDVNTIAKWFRRASSGKPTDTGELNDYEACIAKMCENLPFQVAKPWPDDHPLAEFQGLARELRTDEMLLVAAGVELPNAAEIKAATLPPPRRTPSSEFLSPSSRLNTDT